MSLSQHIPISIVIIGDEILHTNFKKIFHLVVFGSSKKFVVE